MDGWAPQDLPPPPRGGGLPQTPLRPAEGVPPRIFDSYFWVPWDPLPLGVAPTLGVSRAPRFLKRSLGLTRTRSSPRLPPP